MRGQWIQIAENKILVKCGLPYFSMSLSLPGFYIIIASFCPRFAVGNVRLFLSTSSNTAYSLSRTGILDGFYGVPTKMDRSSVCPRQVSRFSVWGKAMILQRVPFLPSIKLNKHSELFLTTFFSSCWLLPSRTHHAVEQRHSVNKWRRQAFACRLF